MLGLVYWGYSSSATGEALLCSGLLLAHHPGDQPDAGVDQHQRRDLAAGEHVVADRDLLERPRARSAARRPPRSGRTRPPRRRPWPARRPAPASAARRAGSSAGEGGRRPRPRRSRAPARRPSSPCRDRRRPACRRRCDACRWHERGCPRLERPQAGRQRLAGEADAERAGKHLGKDREHGGAPHDRHSISGRRHHDDALGLDVDRRHRRQR